ncbi:MAG TPA: GGDEF domain-containing protein [Clostridiaceae bacterium]
MYIDDLAELNDILENGYIVTVFQPIVSLGDGTIIGYEALSRGPENSRFHFPDMLFAAAEKYNLIWELEALCRKKAMEKSYFIGREEFLFLNIDPLIFNDEKFIKGFTKKFLEKYNISPESIIFEITEKTAIKDYKSYKNALKGYIEQGYKIAIDDTGSGYSGLKMLSQTKPNYVKIDIDLIRDIHKDSFNQALIKSFVTLSETTNMLLIAEGIENELELYKLMELGVYAGQGFFIQRPSPTLQDIPNEVKELITSYNESISNRESRINGIGEIITPCPSLKPMQLCKEAWDWINRGSYEGIPIVSDNIPVGILMRETLEREMSSQYGEAIFYNRPISLLMDINPLIVDFYCPISDVAKLVLKRRESNTYDYIIVTKGSFYSGIVTIKKLLEFTSSMFDKYKQDLNPITGLPGDSAIDSSITYLLNYDKPSCILHFDIKSFRSLNNLYGFMLGDKVLKFVGNLIFTKVKAQFPYNSFVGHKGGDDFISIIESSKESVQKLCADIIEDFNKSIPDIIDSKDKADSISLSIAGLYGSCNSFCSRDELHRYIDTIEEKVKQLRGSNFIINEI